jgi:hypothetical protein
MTKRKSESVTKNVALRAFDYAVCRTGCKNTKDKVKICIENKGGCDIRNNFIKKLDQ